MSDWQWLYHEIAGIFVKCRIVCLISSTLGKLSQSTSLLTIVHDEGHERETIERKGLAQGLWRNRPAFSDSCCYRRNRIPVWPLASQILYEELLVSQVVIGM